MDETEEAVMASLKRIVKSQQEELYQQRLRIEALERALDQAENPHPLL